MSLFEKLKAKRYWKSHQVEQKQLECEGNELLIEFNDLVRELNIASDIKKYESIKERIFDILDWFIDLEVKRCPYHLIESASEKKMEIGSVFNYGLGYVRKATTEDFDQARNLLVDFAVNYKEVTRMINRQEKEGVPYLGNGCRFVTILKYLFEYDKIVPEPLIECGVPPEIVLSRDKELIHNAMPEFSSDQEKDDYNAYSLKLKQRYRMAKEPLKDIPQLAEGINLQEGEKMYSLLGCVTEYEEIITRNNISYGGLRWQFGLARGGNVTYTSQVTRNFIIQDLGSIYITDRRIIFLGKQRHVTRVISFNSLVSCELYKDGVLVRTTDHNAGILFKFEPMQRYQGLLMLQDGLNEFQSVVGRIMTNTADQELK